jgi:3-isopropylmalate/(R)-2-methylmalate dehydratase large subunit
MSENLTLFDKVWDAHVVKHIDEGPDVLFIDRHLVHEVTSPVAFKGLDKRKIEVLFPEKTFATADHNTPTENQHLPVRDPLSAKQLQTLEENTKNHHISYWGLGHEKNGIVHVIGPENGITLPGATIVCGDSHTSTHGAFGAIAFGIGTSEVEMVLSSQCVMQMKPKKMRITVNGFLQKGVSPKDVALYIISQLTTSGATGYFVEYAGEVFSNMTMEGRMTVCNMSIEMGARGGMIAPDEKTYSYLKNRTFAPRNKDWDNAMKYWTNLSSDKEAQFDKELIFDGFEITPMITFGTNPGMGVGIHETIPNRPSSSFQKSMNYMNFKAGEKMLGKKIDYAFLGSCTNGRLEDFEDFAQIVKGNKKSPNVSAWLVPGSQLVAKKIKESGTAKIIEEAGFEIREPGCSACLAMNDDKVPAGKYAISTSNRNFEGRQGPGSRTLLASPLVVAAAAITGEITDPRKFIN